MGRAKKVNAKSKGTAKSRAAAAASKREERTNRAAARKRRKQAQYGDESTAEASTAQIDAQLAPSGCCVCEVSADGNCLFRSLSDQLRGSQHQHADVREAVMDFVEANEDDFAPFIEDDEGFDAYVARMRGDGEWGGHQELVAASRLFAASVAVHVHAAPRMLVSTEESECAQRSGRGRALQVVYRGQQHYDSVRRVDGSAHMPEPVASAELSLGPGSYEGGTESTEAVVSEAEKGTETSVNHVAPLCSLQAIGASPAAREEMQAKLSMKERGKARAELRKLKKQARGARRRRKMLGLDGDASDTSDCSSSARGRERDAKTDAMAVDLGTLRI